MAGMFGDTINARADFFIQLAQAQHEVAALLQRLPYEAPLKEVEKQLASIGQWTANGRIPTKNEQDAYSISRLSRLRVVELNTPCATAALRRSQS